LGQLQHSSLAFQLAQCCAACSAHKIMPHSATFTSTATHIVCPPGRVTRIPRFAFTAKFKDQYVKNVVRRCERGPLRQRCVFLSVVTDTHLAID
jgi:hypothetical protein